jgi:hypothetical protein
MTTFKITFKHNVDDFYTATVEAETKEQAIEKFEDSPFDYLLEEDEEPFDTQGNTLDIIETIEE